MLPTGYKLLEYIQSTGSQYVDTEFKPNQDTKVVLGVRLTDTTVSANNLFGARTSTTSNVFSASTVSTNYWRHGYNTSTVSTGVAIDGEKHEIVLDKNAMSIDGVVISTATEGTFTCPVSATIGRIAVKATTVYAGYAEFYYCSIYDNDTLIRQYVPCINPDGEVGLYDLVNSKFYGDAAGVGFTAGPELTELEWIESDGSQYIDTGFVPNQDTRVVMDFELLSLNNAYADPIFGVRTSASSNAFYLWAVGTNTAAEQYQSGYNNGSTYPGVARIGRHIVDKNKNVTTVDDVTTTATYTAFTAAWTMLIFNSYNNGSLYNQTTCMRFYSGKVYDNGTLVRDYVPMVTSDGTAGLYDLVNNTFETDAAGGNFIAGPVVVSGIPAPENLTASITDGSVELTWDAVEDALFYTVLQDGIAIATTTETAYSGALVPFANTIYSVTAVNDEFESSPAETLVQYIPEEYDLITDRTSADVQRVKYLRETGWAAMTDDERTEFLSPLKGAYNASDLNRVEYAAKQLADRLNALPLEFREHAAALNVAWSPLFDVPYTPPSIETRYDWTVRDIPDVDSMSRYLGNVTLLRGLLDYATAALPSSIDKLTYTGANAIEAALERLFAAILSLQSDRLTLINNTAAAWFYSGEIYGGEV